MKTLILGLRSSLFYICYVLLTAFFSATTALMLPFVSFNFRFRYLSYWSLSVITAARWICGVSYEIHGREHIKPGQPMVIMSNHQSQWETYLLMYLFRPVSIIIKQELLEIPGFGWSISKLKPIAINRDSPKQALKDIQAQGIQRLTEEGLPIMIFPEGHRHHPEAPGKYARSGAQLALSADVPVMYVSHNAGYSWPADQFLKYPGHITVTISPVTPVDGQTSKQIMDGAKQWIENHVEHPKPADQ
ncbi:Uncharacterised protein [BD1-7 clade bacterium]|uniref:Phospholipid/glycerol acyltransferase domain-containing protein n=1 Tax=BD1-7 clade bacterium TaxID=2029982 RepID=A0A5S9QFF4_9GAMM|nr:Uncharacterised protein [BD1-7 clade bacterium]